MLRSGQQSLTFYLYSHVVFARADQVAALAPLALLLALITYAPLLIYLIAARKPLQMI
jgi:hypothetical protein